MQQPSSNKRSDKHLVVPHPEKVEEATSYFWSLALKPAQFVIIFKLHNLSKRKIRLLLEAIITVTNLIATILQSWKEDVARPREDGAIAAIFDVQQKGIFGRFRARGLSTTIEGQFASVVAAAKHHLHSRLIVGACRDVGQMIVGWAEQIADVLLEDKPKETVLGVDSFRTGWIELVDAYQRATELVISLDYNPDHPPKDKDEKLVRKSKHEARWKLAHLKPLEEVEHILAAIEALLEEMPSTEQENAMYTELLWERRGKHQRGVRENWFFQRILISADDRRILGELERGELVAVRDKLYELKLFLERAQDIVGETDEPLEKQGSNSEDRKVAEIVVQTDSPKKHTNEPDGQRQILRVRKALETFLYRKPASFPQVEPFQYGRELIELLTAVDYRKLNHRERPRLITWAISGRHSGPLPLHLLMRQRDMSDVERQPTEQESQYNRRLRWFQLKPQRKGDAERFLSSKREGEEVQGMFAALRAMKRPKLMPLNFIGSMRPLNYSSGKRIQGHYRDGALLYEEKTENGQTKLRFVFLAILHPHKGMEYTADERQNQTLRTKQHAWYQQSRATNPLKYVAYLLTPVCVPEGVPYELFRLECGQRQHEQLLREIMAAQETAQSQIAARLNQGRKESVPIAKCLPEHNPLPSAKIKLTWDKNGLPVFFLHQRVTLTPEKLPMPKRVIAFSPFEDRYAFAVLSFNGSVERVGDVYISRYLDPRHGAKRFSDNYIFWVATSMTAKAWAWEAWIGIEDTLWTKKRASTSREENRQIFSVPVRRVIEAVKHKARQEGHMEPRLVENVSPAYDCANCHRRLDKGEKTIVLERAETCPTCRNVQMMQHDTVQQTCGACGHFWQPDWQILPMEQFFVCRRCQALPRLARHNRAIVVAQKMLMDIVNHYDNALAKRKRDEQDKTEEDI